VLQQGKYNVALPDGSIQVDEAQLRGRGSELLVWSWYLIGSVSTSNNYEAKILQLKTSVGINGPGIYRVVLAMPMLSSLEATREQMQRFFNKHGEALYNGLQP
jgi:EpsI family protein